MQNYIIKIFFFIVIFFFGIFGLARSSQAVTINTASCSQTDIQAAITSATTGDTVVVPSGSCIWTTSISIPDEKKITLQGAGMNFTVITTSGINMTTSGSRVTGFGFIGGGIVVDGDGWRIDHCSFYSTTFYEAVFARGIREGLHPTGLVDNCSFHNGRVLVGTAFMFAEGNTQHQVWAKPLNLGSADNTIFVEDNVFTFNVFGNVIDENYGGGYVFRYNTILDSGTGGNSGAYIEAHSVQGNNRAARKWEIYGNIINNTGDSIYYPFRIRGGTGAIFYNSVIGTWTNDGIALDNVRSYADTGDGHLCNGNSTWDGNEDSTGYPCRDQIGRGGDAVQWIYSPPGAYTQILAPAYMWLNRTETNNELSVDVINSSGNHIKANRDFYAYNVSFDGTAGNNGMGCGSLTNRPSMCIAGQSYWATNQLCSDLTGMVGANPTTPISGTLYKCTATNTWTAYYDPYTYPHPLQNVGTSDTTPPAAPTGLSVN